MFVNPSADGLWSVSKGIYDVDIYIGIENLLNVIHSEVLIGDFGTQYIEDRIHIDKVKCLKFNTQINPEKKFKNYIGLNCVTFTKKILGINDFSVNTPKKLYDYLLIKGAKNVVSIFPEYGEDTKKRSEIA